MIFDVDSLIKTKGGVWDPSVSHLAPLLHKKYGPLLPILRELKELLVRTGDDCNQNPLIRMFQDVHNVRMVEAAQRWLQHHSAPQPGDAVILGASSPQQMEDNIVQWCAT